MSTGSDDAAQAAARKDIFRRGYLPVFAGAVCISFGAFFVKGASVPPSAVAFYRLFFGAIVLCIVAVLKRESFRPTRKIASLMLFAGVFFALDLLFWHDSIVLVGPGIATILTNFQVLFLALYGVIFLKESMSWAQYLAIPVALAGLVFLLGLHNEALPPGILRGGAYGLLSALFYSGYVLGLRQTQYLPERLKPTANIACVSMVTAVCIGIYCLLSGVPLAIPDLRTGLTLAMLGIVCQSIGWLLLSMGLPHLSPFRAGILMLTQPTLSFVWDALFYGSITDPTNYLGALLAIGAIGMGMYSPAKHAAAKKAGVE